VEDRADALLATGRAAEVVGDLEAAVAEAPLRERRWGQLMLALYRAGRQGEALSAYQRARSLLVDELGVDPGPELRRLEAAIVAQDISLEIPAAQDLPSVTRAVTFLLTDIEGSTAAWEADADAMAVALARHDELVEQVVTSRGGRLIKTRGEGDATFSVFERPSGAAAAAIELQDAIGHEPWMLRQPMRIRIALHTGEVELRDGDYFGRAVNRAARLRSVAEGGQILCSGATAELVIDSLSDDVLLIDLGTRQLKNLARPEHVFELRLETADEQRQAVAPDEPVERPSLPAVLAGPGPFVGRGRELARLFSAWQSTLAGGTNAVLIAGEPGVGKTRLSGEWSRQAYDQGALVIYGRCDEDLGAPYQPFAEALRSLVPCLGAKRLRGMRGVEALLALVPGLTDVLPDLAAATRADPDTERFALFDAVVALLGLASAGPPVVLILDDLHWAAKPTLLLLRHLLRFGEQARVQIVGTYRSTDLDRAHPLAAMLADLHRDGTANRIQLGGLDEKDVTAYVAEAGYDDEELARALASVTGGNPFFLIEALRHVEESGGHWDPSTLPQGVREAVSRRLSRLTPETNKALGAAAVVGSRFSLELVERVVEDDLVDAFDEACKAGIVIEEPGGNYRFNHALVRQSLLAELASVRRMRLHQRIATTLENQPGADDELLSELAYHYFECAWAGNAAKAVDYCRRAADQAMARLAYEGAADLYDRALHALEEIDDELPDRDDQAADLLVTRCEALLAAGDVATAASAVTQLQRATTGSARLTAWATCFDGELSMLVHPERLDEIEVGLGAAASKLAELGDAAGEAKAHTVRAGCLARLGRVGDCEVALDDALTAARRAGEHRRVNAVLAGAPLAALWGPNPVPRAGGRCLDVVRLLRITTDSPAVEATSTRCQAVLEAFRGRAAPARRMIESARRTVTELGLRHALLEVEQFAGIVELVVDDSVAAEPHLRQAYNGFRRMGLDADTAETAALLGRACLALERVDDADELCTESERLAGHALKPAIAWRMLRAELLSRRGDHDEARRVAEAAVALAERTDALVDHGDACLALATVLGVAGDLRASRAAAERAVDLYDRKGAAALAEKARAVLGKNAASPVLPKALTDEPTDACVRMGSRLQPQLLENTASPVVEFQTAAARASERLTAAVNREAWDEFEQMVAPECSVESRRKVVGFKPNEFRGDDVMHQTRCDLETGILRLDHVVVAVRGERLAIARIQLGTPDVSPGAPQDELLQLYGVDEGGRITLQVWFDLDDMDAAIAELDALYARFDDEAHRQERRLENAAGQLGDRFVALFAAHDWDALAQILADDFSLDDRRRLVGSGISDGRDAQTTNNRVMAELFTRNIARTRIATRGRNLILTRLGFSGRDEGSESFLTELLVVVEINDDERIVAGVSFDLDDFDAAIAELDRRYLAGEAAPHQRTWSVIAEGYAALRRGELPPTTPDAVNIDHRRAAAFAPGEGIEYLRAGWDLGHTPKAYVEAVHQLNDLGAVVTHRAYGTSPEGFDAEWRTVLLATVDGDAFSHTEIFDEADVDAALARFDELSRPARRLENVASRLYERFKVLFAARDWGAIAERLSESLVSEDRRRVVNSGVRHGRDAMVAELSAMAEVGLHLTSDVVATRGEHLVLIRVRASGQGQGPDSFSFVAFDVNEIDADERLVARIVFDLDDFDAAVAELDRRYLAREAAAHSHAWSVIVRAYWSLIRHELPPTTPNWVNLDHRRGVAFAPGDMTAYLRDILDSEESTSNHIEVVHRLNSLGAVFVQVLKGTSQEGFDAEWRLVTLMTVEGDLVSRAELFDEADLDAAIAKFEQLSRPVRHLENAASQMGDRFLAYFAAGNWDAMPTILADNYCNDDRRRLVGGGVRHGRDAQIADMRAVAELWPTRVTSRVVATRGKNVGLTRLSFSTSDAGSEKFVSEIDTVGEIDSDGRIATVVVFDVDEFEAAIAELDARYLASEAADYAQTWSVIMRAQGSLIRHELPATTPDWVNLDHRRGVAFAPGDMTAYLRARWDSEQGLRTYIEIVHRLNNLGAVFSQVLEATSPEGVDAEWRIVGLITVAGELVDRAEIFDEADLDAAIAKFEQLSRPVRHLENAASQMGDRFLAYFAADDWDALAEILAEDFCNDDRRRVVGSGVLDGRDAQMANTRATAELFNTNVRRTRIAIRGRNLVLTRLILSARGEGPDAFLTEVLVIIEINADEKIASMVFFDLDDFDAAIAELDARYLAGEAARYSHTWSMITEGYAALNRCEVPATAPDHVSFDHRRAAAFAPGQGVEYLRAGWDLGYNAKAHIEAVHRLSDLGAVVTHSACGTSPQGFDAEWRTVTLNTVNGDAFNRSEIFDEADLDAAIAKFDQLSRPARRLGNAASRVAERFLTHFAARDWASIAKTFAEDFSNDDRRRVVGAGVRHGLDAEMADLQSIAGVGITKVASTPVAIRGEHLVLTRGRLTSRDQGAEAFFTESLAIVEIDANERIVALINFDLEDVDAAFEELDARYLAGEAAPYSRTWSLTTQARAAWNRHVEYPTTEGWVNIDHRRGRAFEPGDLVPFLHATWNLMPDLKIQIEAVHRLTNLGAVVTDTAHGTSPEGFDAEWSEIVLLTFDGDLLSGCELFDETELDAALARFDQLERPTRRLGNAAIRSSERLFGYFAAGEWDAVALILADDFHQDDRRRVVGAGVRHGRAEEIADLRAISDLWAGNATPTYIATRGERLALMRLRFSVRDHGDDGFVTDVLGICEINAEERIVAAVSFDLDDLDAAFEELDARYLAGEAAAHARTWRAQMQVRNAYNQHKVFPTTEDFVSVDHRRGTAFPPGEMVPYLDDTWNIVPDLAGYIEAVHRLSDSSVLSTVVRTGTSQDGFDAEWREIGLVTFKGDQICRFEVFDEADLQAALDRFDELQLPARQLENAACRAWQRFQASLVAEDWAALTDMATPDAVTDDRRRVIGGGVHRGRDTIVAIMRTINEIGLENIKVTVVATRGERLVLDRVAFSGRDQAPEPFHSEILRVLEIDADERLARAVYFDPDDIDAAFDEFEARYIASEAAAYSRTWSLITRGYATLNRRELPPMTQEVGWVDHRRGQGFELAPGELPAYLEASWQLLPEGSLYIAAVHRLSNLGAVLTQVMKGTSQAGFDAEWREIGILTIDGDLINRAELFNETDLDAALARFDELDGSAR